MAVSKHTFHLPGLLAHLVDHPTDIDSVGCDGLYLEGYTFLDLNLFLLYSNYVCRPFYLFACN